MSNTAHGVTEVKQCRLPPSFGYRTDVSHGAVKTLSAANLANRTTRNGEKTKNETFFEQQQSNWKKERKKARVHEPRKVTISKLADAWRLRKEFISNIQGDITEVDFMPDLMK